MAYSRTEIKKKLTEIMRLVLGNEDFDGESVPESARLVEDMGLNSVGVLYAVVAIEESFGFEFEDVGFSDFRTYGTVIDYIEKKVAK